MALIKKSIQRQTTYSLNIPVDLQQRIEHIAQVAERRDMTFDLDSTLQRAIKNEVTRAEGALGIGSRSRRSNNVAQAKESVGDAAAGTVGDAPGQFGSFGQA